MWNAIMYYLFWRRIIPAFCSGSLGCSAVAATISKALWQRTEDAAHSQMIIVVQGDDRIVRQVDKQLSKLVEVEQVTVLDDDNAVVREHLLMKVERTDATTDHLMAIANVFHANVLNVTENNMIVELTGSAQTLNSFVECYKPYKIQKILRTGSMAMEK